MRKFLFVSFLAILTALGVLLLDQVNVQSVELFNRQYSQPNLLGDSQLLELALNGAAQKNLSNEVSVNNQPSFNAPNPKPLQKTVLTAQKVKTQLAEDPTTVVVPLSRSVDLTSSATKKSIYELVVELSFQGQPTGNYQLYLNLPNLEATADKDAYYAGAISFFEPLQQERATKTLLFDITDELLTQLEQHQQSATIDSLTLTFIKQDGQTGEDIAVESVSLNKYE